MQRLIELRKNRGLRQRDIADYLEIERTTYNRYETGKTEPSHENLIKLATFYDVSIDYLLDYSDKKNNSTINMEELDEDTRDIVEIMESLSEADRKKAVDVYKAMFGIIGAPEENKKDPPSSNGGQK